MSNGTDRSQGPLSWRPILQYQGIYRFTEYEPIVRLAHSTTISNLIELSAQA